MIFKKLNIFVQVKSQDYLIDYSKKGIAKFVVGCSPLNFCPFAHESSKTFFGADINLEKKICMKLKK